MYIYKYVLLLKNEAIFFYWREKFANSFFDIILQLDNDKNVNPKSMR